MNIFVVKEKYTYICTEVIDNINLFVLHIK